MITRRCDGCKEVITDKTFVQLTRAVFETNKDNHQVAEHIMGDYCKKCLDDGEALRDLLGELNGIN